MSEHDETRPTTVRPPVEGPAGPEGPSPDAGYAVESAPAAPAPSGSRWRRAAARVPRGRGVLAGVATFVGVIALLGSFALGRVTAEDHDQRGGRDDHGRPFEPTTDRDGDRDGPDGSRPDANR